MKMASKPINEPQLDPSSQSMATAHLSPPLAISPRFCNISDSNASRLLCEMLPDSYDILDDQWRVIVIVGYATLIAVGIVSNMLIVSVVMRQCTHRGHLDNRARNLYILNLALADLALCCICMPLTLHSLLHSQWNMGFLLCKLTPVIQAANMLVSAGTITAIAIDRYNTIVRSMRGRGRSVDVHPAEAASGLAIIWLLSLLLTSPLFFYTYLDVFTVNGIVVYQHCVERWPSETLKLGFSLGLTAIQFVIPVCILSTIHVKISAFLKRHLRPFQRPKITINSPLDVQKGAVDDDTVNEDRRPLQKEYLGINRKESICSDNSQRSESSRKNSDCSDSKPGSTPDISPRKRNFLSSFRENSDLSFSFSKLSRESSRKSPKRMRRELRRNRRTTVLLACIAAVYAISWLPYHVYNIFTHAAPFFADASTVYKAFAAAHLLAMTSVCVNPFLYGWLNTNFRREFLAMSSCLKNSKARKTNDLENKRSNYEEVLKKKAVLSFIAPKTQDCVVVALFADSAQQPNV